METADGFIDLTTATRCCPGKPHYSALWRWCRKGVLAKNGERIRLRHIRVGSKIFVKPDWLQTFFEDLASADVAHFKMEAPEGHPIRSHDRHACVDRAAKDLDNAGI